MKSMKMAVVFALGYSLPASAGGFNYPDFSDTTGLTLNAAAAVVADNGIDPAPVLRLTPAITGQVGTTFTTDRFDITAFTTQFTFRIQGPADGIVLAFQRWGPTAVGGLGGNIGFQGMPAGPGGSMNVGIEFDVWRNAQDSSNNHIGFNVEDVTSRETVDVVNPMDDASLWYAWIDYDGTTLEVRANQTGLRPMGPLLSRGVDLAALLNGTDAHVGFTSSNGGSTTLHDITSWSYIEVPAPATGWIVLVLLVGSEWIRRSGTITRQKAA